MSGTIRLGDPVAQSGQTDLATAHQSLAALACNTQITTDLGGAALGEGVHCASGAATLTGTLTLSGNANSVFVIRAGTSLTATGTVVLVGGVQAKNVFWVVGGSATLGNTTQWRGNILALSAITLGNNVTVVGRALARNGAVSLGNADTITLP
ncbi:MAG: ice-binding family protein [Gemmatimonadales bacterium]